MPPVTTFSPELTINHGDTFLVTARDGQARSGRHGLYHRDVRYLARYGFTLNGAEPVLLTATNVDFHRSRSFFTNPLLGGYRTEIAAGVLVLSLVRAIETERLVEEWEIDNYGLTDARFTFALTFEASFEDLYQVRGFQGPTARVVFGDWDGQHGRIAYAYRNRDFERSLSVTFRAGKDDRLRHTGDQVLIDKVLPPRGGWRFALEHSFEARGEPQPSGTDIRAPGERAERHREGRRHGLLPFPELRCADDDVVRAWERGRSDLTALHMRAIGGSWAPAAGVPWFATIFGRDSLISAYQLVHGNPGPARAALLRLAQLQSDVTDPLRQAEPGKMPHELRDGELAHFGVPPQRPSYTTADATLLYPILLHEHWRWTADVDLVRELMPVAERCLDWAARYGDLDGDGLQEYLRRPDLPGPHQMGWKDSESAVVDEHGRIPDPPIALVELQGYWYDALVRMAELRERVLEQDGADLRARAEQVQAAIERLWVGGSVGYAFGLDGRKRPIGAVTSNPGHLLWSGVVTEERARAVAERLFAEDMWTGWGIRTLSALNPAYNPISYHRGSVWPHDNALIAMGLRRYGLLDEVGRIACGIVDAAVRFENDSLPELWSGVERAAADFPVPYLDANRPQAWSAATLPLLVRAILGLECDPIERRLSADPRIPERFGEIELIDLEVLGGWVSLRAKGTDLEVTALDADVEVRTHARA